MYVLRRILNPMGTMDAIDFLLDKLRNTKNNADFFEFDEHLMHWARAGIYGLLPSWCRTQRRLAQETTQEKLKVIYGLSILDRVGSLVYGRSVDFEFEITGPWVLASLRRPPGLDGRRLSL